MGCTVSNTKPSTTSALGRVNKVRIRRNSLLADDVGKSKGTSAQQLEIFEKKLGLNERQKFLILKSWKGISRDIKSAAVNMFARFFETNEDLKGYFVDISKRMTLSDIRTSSKFEEHAVLVMHVFDAAMCNLDDLDGTVNLLLNVGKSHRKFPWFKSEYFWRLEEPFLLAVCETLGDRYSSSMDHNYKKAAQFVLGVLESGFETESTSQAPEVITATS